MFLPVLLVRDFGLWGWIAFAVPNVIGAASVGWIMKSPRKSAELTLSHPKAVGLFTIVTLAFQSFTLAWLTVAIMGGTVGALVTAAAVSIAFVGLKVRPGQLVFAALLVWLASMSVAVTLFFSQWLTIPAVAMDAPIQILGLTAVLALGFLTCPFLDVSLHAARQAAGDRAKLVFGLGYGLFFLALILLTLGYAVRLPGLMLARFDGVNGIAAMLIAVHLAVQVAFTNAAHLSSLRQLVIAADGAADSVRPMWLWLPMLLVIAAVGWAIAVQVPTVTATGEDAIFSLSNLQIFGYEPAEFAYRGFLSFYGLIFPAYILLVMLGGASMRAFFVTGTLAAPFLALASFGGARGWSIAWSLPGVTIIIIGFFIARTHSPRRS